MQWELQLFNHASQTLIVLPVQNDDVWVGILKAHVDTWLGDTWTPLTYLLRMRIAGKYACTEGSPDIILVKNGFIPSRKDLLDRIHFSMRTFFILLNTYMRTHIE